MVCKDYTVSEAVDNTVNNDNFQLHTHQEYEVYMFLEGSTKYVVEEKVYSLKAGDIIVIRKNELHRAYHEKNTRYGRMVFWISPDFFVRNNCTEYEEIFLPSSGHYGNKIDAELVHSSGLYDAIMRLKKYTKNFEVGNTPISDSIITEILYLINRVHTFAYEDISNEPVNSIVKYINENYTSNIRLEDIAEKFFISKYHLCRIFKSATGLTVQGYIKQKRLSLARDLCSSGKSLSDAASMAGFGDYSGFYRTYVKEYGVKPKSKVLK